MKRKRLTQVFPFLLPIRKWQRKKLFYLEYINQCEIGYELPNDIKIEERGA